MRNQIIIVDEHEPNRRILTQILSAKYTVIGAESSEEAISFVEAAEDTIAAILIDIMMSQSDSFSFLKTIEQYDWHKRIPVLVISGDSSVSVEKKLFEYGVSECISKPFDAALIRIKVRNIIRLFQYQNTLQSRVEHQTETLSKQYMILKQQAEQLKKSNETIIDLLGTMVEYRNLESGEHIRRVKRYTEILATELINSFPEVGLTPEQAAVIAAASPLHDIGKIAIPDTILLKPGRLTDDEYDYMKSHTICGCEILDGIKNAWSEEYHQVSMEICRHHHERYDGKGYPDGLTGSDIPISAQLVSVADVYDALINERVYKDAFPKDKAFRMIITGECGVFSPILMECFRNVREQIEAV